jgi:protein-S-isoprenylcysteine O-methyltransferase Ste14
MDMSNEKKPEIPWKAVIRLALIVPIMLAVLLISAGRWDWWEAWAYTITGLLVLLGSRWFMLRKFPDLALERSQAQDMDNVKDWDRFLMPFTALIGPFMGWVVAGLDQRFGWTPELPDGIQIVGLVVIQLGSLLGTWAMVTNRYFSSHVRIQTDRGHTVVDEGPYQFIRHPGYAGGLISWLATPVFFSSYWIMIPMILVMIASLIRTSREDQTLLEELPGYKEYAQKVRYRILPGIW